jgi:hypothetical protein
MPEALWRSATQTVFALPAETLVFCGHARSGRAVSTVHELRRWHPWLGGTSRDEFLARVVAVPPPGAAAAPMHAHAQADRSIAVHP